MSPIDCIVGARPNFVKIAPILRALDAAGIPSRLVHTGQHYDAGMSEVFFEQLGIRPPDVRLEVGSGSHGRQTGRVLERYEEVLLADRPGGVVVVGDVNSTLACALAASKLGIPVAHVEAGLRSRDRTMPEEINRVLTDRLADLLFLSEEDGRANLLAEGIEADRIHLVGNVMIDTLLHELPRARALGVPSTLGLEAGNYAMATLHRPSNVDDPTTLARLVGLLVELSARLPIVFPIHPRTRARLGEAGLLPGLEGAMSVRVVGPLGYRENLGLMAGARVVLTDSGGMQEETSALGVPCLTLRANTERPVTVALGTSTLVGADLGAIGRHFEDVLAGRYKRGSPIPLWDGRAAVRIADALRTHWGPRG